MYNNSSYLRKVIHALEIDQRVFKVIPEIGGVSYLEQLIALDLYSRVRDNFIEIRDL